ncbi:disulfide isomerase 1 protein [Polychytrium aggregatum]|uniref:disulfide isomerase 1 protein n=1 Tax=Polychytrium aggregatum TaxID=110093 RepID=UPI0022FE00A8|nr:disulfide isomerase 1 protein [Polychytrium aggregatum]KAI9207178.1 disulfide isomerase 1 protein [Polychytrium aggregatum]
MKFLSAAVSFLAASAALVAAKDQPQEDASDVVTLDKDTFASFLKTEPLSLVEFYAPWCGHCKALAPEYEVAATTLKEQNIKLAKVDCTTEADICEEQKVQGYPTLKVFRHADSIPYKGPRKSDGIVSFMKKQALPALSVLEADGVKEFAASDRIVLVANFKSKTSDAYKAYEAVAEAHRNEYLFGVTIDAKGEDSLTLYKTFDEGKDEFDGKFTSEDILSFVKANSIPLMDEISPENYASYVESGVPLGYLFYGSKEQREEFGPAVEKLAKKHKGKVSFVYCDGAKFGGHAKNLNLKGEWPGFVIQNTQDHTKYPFDESLTIGGDEFAKYLDDFVSGTLEPSLKSQEIPETNDEPVKVVVGKNYQDIVLNEANDVLIEFYAPWCGHCKKLAPIYDELAEKLKDVKGIVIAKMDATENDIPPGAGFTIEAFPTIKLVKAKDNTVVPYEGSRTLDSFLEFLHQSAVHGSSVPLEPEEEEEDDAKTDSKEHDEL